MKAYFKKGKERWGGGGEFRVDKFLLLMKYLKNIMQEEGSSNKEREMK
jgi:hypothetical protein